MTLQLEEFENDAAFFPLKGPFHVSAKEEVDVFFGAIEDDIDVFITRAPWVKKVWGCKPM